MKRLLALFGLTLLLTLPADSRAGSGFEFSASSITIYGSLIVPTASSATYADNVSSSAPGLSGKLDTAGGSISGALTVQGNLVTNGTLYVDTTSKPADEISYTAWISGGLGIISTQAATSPNPIFAVHNQVGDDIVEILGNSKTIFGDADTNGVYVTISSAGVALSSSAILTFSNGSKMSSTWNVVASTYDYLDPISSIVNWSTAPLCFPVVAGSTRSFSFSMVFASTYAANVANYALSGPTYSGLSYSVYEPSSASYLGFYLNSYFAKGTGLSNMVGFTGGTFLITLSGMIFPTQPGNVCPVYVQKVAAPTAAYTSRAGSYVKYIGGPL